MFFGSSAFAVPALRAFAESVDCGLVITQPDRPAGRGHRVQRTPVKEAAYALGLRTLEPERLRDALEELRAAGADLFALASYGKIVPRAVLDLPRLGALNVHPSLLPLYRGATPLQAQLRDGVEEGGVSVILMDEGLDTGDVVLQERRAIAGDETYGELHDRFAALGAEMLAQACARAAEGTLRGVPQQALAGDARIAATFTRPLRKDDLNVDWTWPAVRIANFVRSLSPAPAARAELDGERVKILRARAYAGDWSLWSNAPAAPGTITGAEGPSAIGTGGGVALVATGEGILAIERLVPANRAPMDGYAFARSRLGGARE